MAAANQANVFTIFEVPIQTGPGTRVRGIVLRGRSLPFEGVAWGTELNVDINYFPGNPVAIAQVVGAEWTDTTVQGRWSDRFLLSDEHAPNLFNFPELASQELPTPDPAPEVRIPTVPTFLNPPDDTTQSGGVVTGDRARTARQVRDAIFTLCRSGQLLRVEWGTLSRFGYIRTFTPTHDREQDIDWEIEFTWIGDTDIQPRPQPQSKDLVSTVKLILQFWNDILTFLASAALFVETYRRQINQFARRMESLASDFVSTLERMIRTAIPVQPADLLGSTRASCQGVVNAANDVLAGFEELGAKVDRMERTNGQDPAGGIVLDNLQHEFRKLTQRMAAAAERERANIDRYNTPAIRTVVRPFAGTSLRDISIDQFGTPNNWRAIQDFNGFPDSVVPAGAVVRVPDIPSNPQVRTRVNPRPQPNSLNVTGVL